MPNTLRRRGRQLGIAAIVVALTSCGRAGQTPAPGAVFNEGVVPCPAGSVAQYCYRSSPVQFTAHGIRNPNEWPVYGGDAGGLKYSALTQIDRSTVSRHEVAWTWKTREQPIDERHDRTLTPARRLDAHEIQRDVDDIQRRLHGRQK